MKKLLYNISINLKIFYIKSFGSKLDKTALLITELYYNYLSQNLLHEEAIYKILKDDYQYKKSEIEQCNRFIYSSKISADSILESKYGKRSRFLINLFKLILKIHSDINKITDKDNDNDDIQYSVNKLNKNFNKIVLYMYSKFFND